MQTLSPIPTSSSEPARSCEAVQGRITGLSLPVLEGDALVGFRVEGAEVSGDLSATSSADLSISRSDPDGTLHLTGSHVFYGDGGAVLYRTEDVGLTTADGRVENRMTLVEGGTGTIQTEGTVDLATGALSLTYSGEVCD